MITDGKVIEFFCIADDFHSFFMPRRQNIPAEHPNDVANLSFFSELSK